MIEEPLGDGLTRRWHVDEVLVDVKTAYQRVRIVRTAQGVSLFCDDDRQSTEFSQLTYHEALMVPALLLARRPAKVLVIGSSEGVACQMAADAGAQVDHVDIDEQAVELCAEHLPYGYSPADLKAAERGDGPIRMHYADGWAYVHQTAQKYDVVVVDLPDENEDGQHNRLYGTEFLTACRGLLTSGGVVAYQAGCPTMWRNRTLLRAYGRFNEVFNTVAYYGSDEHEWAFLFGRSDTVDDPTEAMTANLKTSKYRPKTIDDQALRANTVPPYTVRKDHSSSQA